MNNNRQEMIVNKALVTFDVLGKCYEIESNEVVAKKLKIRVIKEQNRCLVLAGDKICYKVIICNDSCVDLNDLDFRDRLDFDSEYERGSFKVNGECKNPEYVGNTLCYHINKLRAKDELVITFETEVH